MEHLFLECAVRSALLVAGTAIVLCALRVKNASARHRIWAGVLLVMLLLPAWTAWGPKAPLRLLPPLPEKTISQRVEPASAISISAPDLQSNGPLPEISQPAARPLVITWQDAALGIYLLGLSLLLLRLAIGTVRARKLIRHAQLRDGKRTSSTCAAPVTLGFINPTVILPEHWAAWPQEQLDAVLTHENEHARRRDPLVQWLALLNRALFWFHPASWWLERELSALAEQACDDVVLSRGHNPRDYAEYLIDVARAVMRSQARLNIAGMAMPGSSLPQRIRQIIERGPAPRISRERMAAVVAACAITGTLFAAGTLDHARLNASAQTARLTGLEALQATLLESKQTDDRPDAAVSPKSSLPSQGIIERIQFDGNRRMRSETLASFIFTRPGDPYNKDALSRDVLALSNTQYFEDVLLDLQDSPDRPNGKIVVFHLTERPVIRRIEYHGIKSITQSEILARFKQRDVRLSVESPLNPATINKAVVALQELLAEHGHPLAVVKSSYEQIPATNAVKLTITVDESPAAALPQTPPTFDVASVKRTQARGGSTSNVLMTPDDVFAPTGGLFSATAKPLADYMRFAYTYTTLLGLPDWTRTDRFDIQASAQGDPTKDQLRLMLQSLLADRFKLSVHKETQQSPVYALVLAKQGVTGPQLQPDNGPCSATPADVQALNTLPGLPPPAPAGAQAPTIACGTLLPIPPSAPGRMHIAGQKVPLSLLAKMATNPASGVDRRVVDHTGLPGTFDMSFEWAPRVNGRIPAGFTPDATGPTFFEAMEQQLGLKLEPQMEALDVLVIDHVEEPSDN